MLGFNDPKNQLKDIMACTLFWHGLYWIIRFVSARLSITYYGLEKPIRAYWAASWVSTVMAVILSGLCYHAATISEMWVKWDLFLATSESRFAVSCFLGYLINDLSLALFYGAEWGKGWEMNVAHHAIVIFSLFQMNFGWGSDRNQYGHCFAMSAGMTELTTPFVNNRWFMDKMDMKSSTVYMINGATEALRRQWHCFLT